jgi:pyruvate kinase
MVRRTKIVATIGPASQSTDMIRRLLTSGVNVARLNFSHGTHEDHKTVFNRLRKVAEEMRRPVCILLDLQGPKIRIGKLPGDEILLIQGQHVPLTIRTNLLKDEIPVDFIELPRAFRLGRILWMMAT